MANSKAPVRKFSSEKAKGYYKLNDEEPTFTARYLGMSKVEAMFPPEQGQTVSARCIDKLHCAVRSKGKRRKVSLLISSNISRGLTVKGKGSKEELCYKLFDIAYCSTDVRNKLIFSFIAECEGELQCHAFVFKTEERANAVCLALSQAFTTAHGEWLRKQKREQSRKEREEITVGTWGSLLWTNSVDNWRKCSVANKLDSENVFKRQNIENENWAMLFREWQAYRVGHSVMQWKKSSLSL